MPPLDGEAPLNEGLTERQAFLAMSEFLWQYARRAGDDLITLLGDIELESDGGPTDPAVARACDHCSAPSTPAPALELGGAATFISSPAVTGLRAAGAAGATRQGRTVVDPDKG